MFRFLRRLPGYVLLALLGVLAGAAVVSMMSMREGGGIDPVEAWALEEVANRAAEYLAEHLRTGKGRLLLTPLAGDEDGQLTTRLVRQIEEHIGCEVLRPDDLAAAQGALSKLKSFLEKLLNTGGERGADTTDLIQAARRVNATSALFGRVERNTTEERTTVKLALRAVSIADGSTILTRSFGVEVPHSWWGSAAYRRIWMRTRAWWARLMLWMAVVVSLPLAGARWVKPLLARERNTINAAVLLTSTAADVLLAWWLTGWAGGAAAVVLLVLGGLAACSYNYYLYSRLAAVA